jgi:hypothetical protein
MVTRLRVLIALAALASATGVRAQDAAPAQPPRPGAGPTICGQAVPAPRALPPPNSGPVVYLIAPCFEAQGGTYLVEPTTYLYYIHLNFSQPSQGIWIPYD